MSTAEPRPDAGAGPLASSAWPRAATLLAAVRTSGEPASLWPAGLALAVAGLAILVLPLRGEPRETALWILVGATLPAAAVAARRRRAGRLRRLLGLVPLLAAVPLAADLRDPVILGLAAVQVALALVVAPRLAHLAPLVVAGALLGWTVALPEIWWQPAGQWLTRNVFDVAVALLGLYLLVAKLCRSELRTQAPARWVPVAGIAAAVLLLGFATLHTYPLFDLTSAYHWSFYIGPALLIRQGATPLWDIPSQYGLGSELAVAWLPGSPWVSLFRLNAAANLAYALVLFALLRAPFGDVADQIASLVLAFFLVFGRFSFGTALAGVTMFPSTGGLRFAWGLLLLLVAVRAAHRHVLGLPAGWLLAAGCALWLAGCVWSFESAVYCSCTWLPALALLCWRSRRRVLLVPPALAAAAIAITFAAVALRSNHLADPRAFFDYALVYGGDGFGALPIAPDGPVWALLLAFAVLAGALAAGRGPGDAGLAAAAGLLWSTASYFVSRSHPSNLVNLGPVIGAAALLALRVPAMARAVLPRQALTAVLAALVIGPFAYELGVSNFVRQVPQPARVDALRPHVDPGLQALLARAGLQAGDPVVYVGSDAVPGLIPVWRDASGRDVAQSPLWLPVAPAEQIGDLGQARREVYLDRFAAAHPGGGWLVQADHPDYDIGWLDRWLAAHYRVTATFSGGGYRVTRYAAG